MPSIKTFHNIDMRPRYWGLEIEDWITVIGSAAIARAASPSLTVSVGAPCLLWLTLKQFKADKPIGHLRALFEYALSNQTLEVAPELL